MYEFQWVSARILGSMYWWNEIGRLQRGRGRTWSLLGRPLYFFLFPCGAVEMDAESIKAGEMSGSPRIRGCEREELLLSLSLSLRAISRPRKDPGVLGRNKKRLWVLNERQSDQACEAATEGIGGGGRSRDDRGRCGALCSRALSSCRMETTGFFPDPGTSKSCFFCRARSPRIRGRQGGTEGSMMLQASRAGRQW